MQIQLTEEQEEAVAVNWIKAQQQTESGYKKVLNTLFVDAHFAKWSWLDALHYAVKVCSRSYVVTTKWIINNLK